MGLTRQPELHVYQHLALSENGFLFDTRTGTTYTLNQTGVWLVRALMTGMDKKLLVGHLKDAFDVDEVTAARDIEHFTFRLNELVLINPT